MSTSYYTIKHSGTKEIVIKKSRFICDLFQVSTKEEADEYLTQVKKEHYKANHHCSAYILRTTPLSKKSSDDGEPSGTAGNPMLNVLENHELTNVLAVTTRYFGGVKLGAGGLIRAYTQSVTEALKEVGLVQGELYFPKVFTLTYSQLGNLEYFLKNNPLYLLDDISYGENLTCKVMVKKEMITDFETSLNNLFNEKINFTTLEAQYFEHPL